MASPCRHATPICQPRRRRVAPVLARVLRSIAGALTQQPHAVARESARGVAELRDAGFAVEYLEIRSADTLMPVVGEISVPSRVFAAVRLGRTRLIDNMPIPAPGAAPFNGD